MNEFVCNRYHLQIHQRSLKRRLQDGTIGHWWDEVAVKNYTTKWHLEDGGKLDIELHYDTNSIYPDDKLLLLTSTIS